MISRSVAPAFDTMRRFARMRSVDAFVAVKVTETRCQEALGETRFTAEVVRTPGTEDSNSITGATEITPAAPPGARRTQNESVHVCPLAAEAAPVDCWKFRVRFA